VLMPPAYAQWRTMWPAYIRARARYLTALLRRPAHPIKAALDIQLADDLNTVLDIVQADAGAHLYAAQNLYANALLSDKNAIRGAVIAFIVALVAGALLAARIARRLNRGLNNLLSTARAITTGALHVRADAHGGDEIAGLAQAFNHMTDALLSAERRADSDALTGLLNHRAFHSELTATVARAVASGDDACVLMIDINNFKLFNDTYGHAVGDRVLVTFADLLRQECRTGDYVARHGGDEFVLLAPGTDLASGRALAQRLLDACARTEIRVREGSIALPLALSIGVASAPLEADAAPVLLELADQRMFESKHGGGGLTDDDDKTAPAIRLSPNAPFGVLEGLVTAIDHKDAYTREHSEWVARFADLMAQGLGFDLEQRQRMWMASLIHDVGKIGIPDSILRKPDKLTDQEYAAMKQHVVFSHLIVAQVLPAPDVVDAVRYHHERWDGRGYPHGVCGTDIPVHGRILILADAASAMYLSRPYRKGLSLEALVAELRRNRGTQFDPELADLFVAALLAPSSPLTLSQLPLASGGATAA